MSEETIEKTFQVTAPARLIISNVRGSITIKPGVEGSIEVRAVKHGNGSGNDVVEMDQDPDGTVRVETRSKGTLLGFLSYPPKVDYFVQVPQGTHLDASGVSNTINVSELEGSFKVKTVSGDIDLEKLSGPFKLGSVSGDITGSQLAGVLDLDTVSGRVRLTESNFPSADGSTVSGDLTFQTPLSEGPYQFNSVSGSVRMLVPADSKCDVELHSVSGSIRSSLPATATHMGHGLKMTKIQGGGAAVRLKSVSGGVSIETEGVPASTVAASTPADYIPHVHPIPPVPPVSTNQSEASAPLSTAEILQRIERGEMTVDEAIKLMKGQS